MSYETNSHDSSSLTLFSDSFQEKTEEEWKEFEKKLKPVIDEVDEDSENRQSPESLIGDEETVERFFSLLENRALHVTCI